jgi:hypothetical protein
MSAGEQLCLTEAGLISDETREEISPTRWWGTGKQVPRVPQKSFPTATRVFVNLELGDVRPRSHHVRRPRSPEAAAATRLVAVMCA